MERKFSKITQGSYQKKKIRYKSFDGIVYAITFKEGIEPSYLDNNVCIKKEKYLWFEVYPNDKKYVLTIMFDDDRNIIQWYFDISKSTNADAVIPYQDDLDIDLVIDSKKNLFVLDEDELLESYEKKEITKEDYEYAYKVLDELKKKYANDIDYLIEFTKYLYTLFERKKTYGKI